MKTARPLLIAALGLALLSACSQAPESMQGGLEPQFGSSLTDYGRSVTVSSSGALYVLSLEGTDDDLSGIYSGSDARVEKGERLGAVTLRRFDRSGALVWTKKQDLGVCQKSTCTFSVHKVAVDRSGNAYIIYSADNLAYYLVKYASSGTRQWQKELKDGVPVRADFGIATDSRGAVYVSESHKDPNDVSRLVKYTPDGSITWTRYLDGDELRAVAVSSDDTVYVLGSYSLSRYSSGGSRKWQHEIADVIPSDGVGRSLATSGDAVYVASNTFNAYTASEPGRNKVKLLRYSSAGSRQWVRTIRSLSYMRLSGVAADVQGGVYLAGRTDPKWDSNYYGPPITDYFARKYDAAGSVVWTQSAALRGSQVANDIAAFNADELYLTGFTEGKVNGKNNGLEDAFLLRLNGNGNRVWSR